jgi:HK97 family phage prohead protease
MTRDKFDRQVRAQLTHFEVREENEQLHIAGYFSVFGGTYEIGPGMTESVDRHAFDNTLGGDIRALTNHDTTLVLGRTKAHTLDLRVDEHGLFGDVVINPNDQDAMNLYERVKRGDVDQCSFGFNIVSEETEFRDDGSIHWTITEVELHEVSVCTFPAYEDTNVSAREAQREALKGSRLEDWKQSAKARLNKEENTHA